jgi:hypothetical protein
MSSGKSKPGPRKWYGFQAQARVRLHRAISVVFLSTNRINLLLKGITINYDFSTNFLLFYALLKIKTTNLLK